MASATSVFMNVMRGGSSLKSFTTTNLVSHLRSKHLELEKEYNHLKDSGKEEKDEEILAPSSSTNSKQLTLREAANRTRVWTVNDTKALRVSHRIGEMTAVDCQPLSIVSDAKFVCLVSTLEPRYQIPSRKYITDKIIPDIAGDVRAKVEGAMHGVKWFSFTSDTGISNDSLLGLTAHWLSEAFDRMHAMLHAQSITGSHTGELIYSKYQTMLEEWGIRQEQVHLFVVDNAANMRRAMLNGEIPWLLFPHTSISYS